MPKVKPKLDPGVNGRMPKHSLDAARGTTKFGHGRDRQTVNRLQLYKTKAYKRDRDGKIIPGAGDLTNPIPEPGAGRTAPNRKWFGNTRVVEQKDLTRFRDAMTKAQADPFSVLLKQRRLPTGLLSSVDDENRALSGTQLGLLANEPFEETFSEKRRRKRPKLAVNSLEDMANNARKRGDDFDESVDQKEVEADERAKRAAADNPIDPDAKEGLRFDDLKDADRQRVFNKGQSKRIWAELHKVVDSSDVVIQVLDARDPIGTRSRFLESFMRKQYPHKHMVLLINKADLVPTWVSTRWLRTLSKEYPTLIFHSSLTNPFGKGSLINLLRQYKSLHSDKKSISCGLVGYPNVGKSSVINTLRGKKVSNVAPIPGETKVWQYVNLFRSIFLVDCPGVVHDSTKNSQNEAILKGVVRIESLRGMAAEYVPALLERVHKKHIIKTYGIEDWERPDDLLEKLARKAGKLLKKGEPDVNTVGRMMLNDFQRGKLPWFIPPPGSYEEKEEGTESKETTEKTAEKEEKSKDEGKAGEKGDASDIVANNKVPSDVGAGVDVVNAEEETVDDSNEHVDSEVTINHENIKKLKVSDAFREEKEYNDENRKPSNKNKNKNKK